ncbi:hypothetical protein ACFL1H_07350 [Nanoarchaeota archaeon]
MNLQFRERQKIRNVPIVPSNEVMAQVARGSKFIPVEKDFNHAYIPHGYSFLDMKYKGVSFKILLPQNLIYFNANPGEGNIDEALDELWDGYNEAEDYEDELIINGQTNVQESNLATMFRLNYRKYVINKLVVAGCKIGEDGEPIAEYDEEVLNELDINDSYVNDRVKGIAALALGKSTDEMKKFGVGDLLKHKTLQEKKIEKLTSEEFKEITCWAGSHYEILPEYQKEDDISYNIDKRHDKGHMVGTKTYEHRDVQYCDSKINELEKEIVDYRTKKHGEVGRHDDNLLRMYTNLSYIAKEDKTKQLDVVPTREQIKDMNNCEK